MRVVVSGTHASGKSTLISDFAARNPGFVALPDPFELIEESWDSPGPAMFAAQLRIAADRLQSDEYGGRVIAERGPLDFLAYLLAWAEVSGSSVSPQLIERGRAVVVEITGDPAARAAALESAVGHRFGS